MPDCRCPAACLLSRLHWAQARLVAVRRSRHAVCLTVALCAGAASAGQFDILGPAGSASFGKTVAVLPNGNIVITDPDWNSKKGAVHLYSPAGILLNTVAGDQANDAVGSGGVVVLKNGNYVIPSPAWHNYLGAATWGSASTGVAGGVVSAGNSLVGTSAGDGVGTTVTVLGNGNYVVGSPYLDYGLQDMGAATWGNGNSGTAGVVSASNSLVGATIKNYLGQNITALANGNYVVSSPYLSSRGAVTWGNGNGGTVGAVSASNSLVGTTSFDQVGVGVGSVTTLNNGNYVVSSPYWDNGAATNAGAATWGNGNGGTVGTISAGNSLIGTASDAEVGRNVTALGNGHYVVGSPFWDNGATTDVGAATWGNGNGGTVGTISPGNSLVGTNANDMVGYYSAIALSNGHYVVRSSQWNNGAATQAGAATWGNGNGGTVGQVSAVNSLIGTTSYERVGDTVTALSNGNYVVITVGWDNGAATGAGAATWSNGNGGTVGTISPGNSLVGTVTNDSVGNCGVAALDNGNYVVCSRSWNNGAVTSAGAATWGNGSSGTTGTVSATNSLVGNAVGNAVSYDGITALGNGNYVVRSSVWSNGAAVQAGAATWGNGSGGTMGAVSSGNSLVGTATSDRLGSRGAVALGNGDYVVSSSYWNNGGTAQAGAITLRRGWDRQGDIVTAENSVRGLVANAGASMSWNYDTARDQLVVGRPMENIVTLFKADLLFRNGFE